MVPMLLLISCDEPKPTDTPPIHVPLYKSGELVYVGESEYIVRRFTDYDNQYLLQKVECRSEECSFWVLESEIRKTKEPRINEQ